MNHQAWSELRGTARYEFMMQVQRPEIWIAFALFSLSLLTIGIVPWNPSTNELGLRSLVANSSLAVQFFFPIAFGILLADRFPRDRRLGIEEMIDATPSSLAPRFIGRFAGTVLATLAPVFTVYGAGIGYIVLSRGEWTAIWLGLAAFTTINLPGLLFVAAFSLVVPVLLWLPLYQFLFTGYWFWGNLLPPGQGAAASSRRSVTPCCHRSASTWPAVFLERDRRWSRRPGCRDCSA